MASTVTLDQVKALAERLPPREQLRLVAHIGQRLSGIMPNGSLEAPTEERLPEERVAKADALLQQLDTIADSIEGEFDSARDIREIREERLNRL